MNAHAYDIVFLAFFLPCVSAFVPGPPTSDTSSSSVFRLPVTQATAEAGLQTLPNLAPQTLPSHAAVPPLPGQQDGIYTSNAKAVQVTDGFDPFGFTTGQAAPLESSSRSESSVVLPIAAGVAASAAMPQDALAKGGEYGIFEGRISSLAHPTIMAICFLISLGALYTGLQWRRIRDIQTEVNEMKSEMKPKSDEVARFKAMEELSAGDAAKLKTVEAEVAEMTKAIDEKAETRKELTAKNFRDRHWALGSVLLGLGISFAIEGPVNTYMRAGKLFPGPHLYAGAGCVSLWALAAALVPQMQKGKDWARTTHIGLNVTATGLFAYYQIPTGLEIAAKVIEKTKFP